MDSSFRSTRWAWVVAAVAWFVASSAPVVVRSQATRPAAPGAFTHPGLLHGAEELARIRQKLAAGQEPWTAGFAKLRDDRYSKSNYKMRGPFELVARDPKQLVRHTELVDDCNAAYQNALMWSITGDEAHARKAVEILNAWGRTFQRFEGRDVQLGAGLDGFKLVNAAEVMRATYPKWEPGDVRQFQRMLTDVIYPPLKDFATFANGNWDGACIKTMLAIGVFCDDRAMFDRAVDYYLNGAGNGRLTHYVINEAGQCQESGRDQSHTQLGLACLAEACEVAWHQGVDLYGADDNRLLKGFEYTARYNLGFDVPFVPHTDTTGKSKHKKISSEGRGELRPVYEMVLNHYTGRRGLEAPYTKQAAEKVRPEGAAFAADHPGFGTLMFTR